MNPFALSWVELCVAVSLVGAVFVGRARHPDAAYRWCVGFSAAALACTVLAALGFVLHVPAKWGLLPREAGTGFAVDEFSAPLLPLVALLHFLTALSTARTKITQVSFAWMLAGAALRLAAFASTDPWAIIGLLAAATLPPLFELRERKMPTRVYLLHTGAFVALLVAGWALADAARGFAGVLLVLAVLVRGGVVPFHLWVADLCENGTFGNALLFVTPLTGAYLAVRLVLPVAPEWALVGMNVAALVTVVYAAGMALVQTDARRFFAYLFLSQSALIMVGLDPHATVGLTGALVLWLAAGLSLGGLGLTLRALESRVGRLALSEYRGLYDHSPTLAVGFLLCGLAVVGFPGTIGFVASEMLFTGLVEARPVVGVGALLAAALNGIAIMRAYLLLFTGRRHTSTVSLAITPRERVAVLVLVALILLGGLVPQGIVESRFQAAEAILRARGSFGS